MVKMITKEELIALANKNCLTACDIEDALRFVSELLERKAAFLEKTEPYAKVTIRSLYDAAHEVNDLEYDIDEIVDGDYE